MIRIACTNCQTVLSIDDAFAGGVCRCQHCGTIQTVPAAAKESAGVAASGQSIGVAGGAKSLYQNESRPGAGLNDLAGVVVSSGLSSGRLTAGRPAKPNLTGLWIGIGAVIALLVAVILFLVMRPATPPPAVTVDPGGHGSFVGSTPPVAASPNFCTVPVTGSTVIYLIDCGQATSDYLGLVKDAAVKSLGSLGTDHKFQILFWNDNNEGAYPTNVTTYATRDSIDAARRAISDLAAFGQTDVKPSLIQAMTQHPDTIELATAKGDQLDDAWVDGVMSIRGDSTVKIDTYSLGSAESPALKSLAAKTGGTYRMLSKSDLKSYTD